MDAGPRLARKFRAPLRGLDAGRALA